MLRRHIGDGAEGGAGGGEEILGEIDAASLGRRAFRERDPGVFGEAEVEKFGVAASGDENVGRLDFAVDDAFRMSGIESISDLNSRVEKQIQFEGAAGDAFAKRLAFQKLHGDEGAAFVFADFVNCADVGMVQGGSGAGFPPKALEGLAIVGESLGEKLQSNMAAEAEVFGFEYFAHAASAEFAKNAIVRDGFAEQDSPDLGCILRGHGDGVNEVELPVRWRWSWNI